MVKIRLKRMGMRHRPTYRIVVMDSQRPRDGEYIESLGHYDPRTKQLSLNIERARYWQSVGARPTETAGKLIKRAVRDAARTPDETPTARVPPEEQAEAAVELAREVVVDSTETTSPPQVTAEPPEPEGETKPDDTES